MQELSPMSDLEADLQTLAEITDGLPIFEALDLQRMFEHFKKGAWNEV